MLGRVDGGQGSRPGCTKHPSRPAGTKTLEIKEWFQNREDMLELKHIDKSTGLNVDYFKPGHPQALRGECPAGRPGWGRFSFLEQPPCGWPVLGGASTQASAGLLGGKQCTSPLPP